MSKPLRALVTLGLLFASASAAAEPASSGAAAPVCNAPMLQATPATAAPMPLDARVLLQPLGCYSPDQAKVTLTLTGPAEGAPTPTPTGTDVPVTSTFIRAQNGTFVAVKPGASLESSTGYTLTLTTPNFASQPASVSFTTGSTTTTPTSALPTVQALSGSYSQSGGGAAYGSFALRLAMPEGGAVGGALYVNGRKTTRDALGNDIATTDYLVPDIGAKPVEISLSSVSVVPGQKNCFTVTYEDPSGRLSADSAESCVVATRAPDPTPTTSGVPGSVDGSGSSTGSGCSAAPEKASFSSSALLGAVGVLGFFAWRRREKR